VLSLAGIDRRFGNADLQTWTLGLERVFAASRRMSRMWNIGIWASENVISKRVSRADSEFARFTNFDSSGAVTGGFGFESVMTATSHSSYTRSRLHCRKCWHGGPSVVQAGYTWGKSLDDVSGIIGGTGSTAP